MKRAVRRTGIAVGAALAGTLTVLTTLPASTGQHAPTALAADREPVAPTSTSPYRVPPPPPPVDTHYDVPDAPLAGGATHHARSYHHPHRLTHPDQDGAGSQIARHEGGGTADDDTPRSAPAHGRFRAATPSAPSATTEAAPQSAPPSTALPLPSLPLPLPSTAAPAPPAPGGGSVPGLDVSGHQGNVNWAAVAANGARFAYVKATEGDSYRSPAFDGQYNGSFGAGLTRGAYHFALPDVSSGTQQADYFVAHGGGWSPDGRTLPPALDMEYNPYGADCYGLTGQQMTDWVRAFSDEVHARTGRYPMIYTSTRWWNTCTGGSTAFGQTNPLWIPRYGSSIGALPAGWSYQTIWQFADAGTFPGDQNTFNGAAAQLDTLARG